MNILVVDDKQSVLNALTDMLTTSGYNVQTACNGLDAFEKSQQFSFDLFIIDHLMPIMNGLQLSKNLRQQEKSAKTPILFITTQDFESVSSLAEASLFNAILTKPINQEKLIDQILLLDNQNIQRQSL